MSRTSQRTSQPSRLFPVVAACFFATGAAGLIYEIIWNRTLALLMGNTAYSLATLLTVFMGGLALGAWVGGHWPPRGRWALRTYGLLELGIGLYCLLLPRMLDAAAPLFTAIYRNHYGSMVRFNLMQFCVVGLILLIPTTMMGATLPILTRFLVTRMGVLSRTVGVLYAVNSGGAFVGALLCGLLLLPTLGVERSYLVAILTNGIVGLIAIALSYVVPTSLPVAPTVEEPLRGLRKSAEKRRDPERPGPAFTPGVLLLGFGLSGFAAMVYQVAWTRSVTLSTGSSTYAFTLIAGAFILGLTLGSLTLGWMGDRSWGGYVLGLLPVLIGLTSVITVAALGRLPVAMSRLLQSEPTFAELQWSQFRTVFFIYLLPTFCMGGMLPIVSRFVTRGPDDVARSVGNAYAANALGTILGSFAGGFLLIPWVGMRWSILIGAGISSLVGAVFLYQAASTNRPLRLPLVAGVVVLAGLAILVAPRWDQVVMTSGPFIKAKNYASGGGDSDAQIRARMHRGDEIIYYREGVSTLVTVTQSSQDRRSLITSGKPDAFSYASTQNWLGHLPMLLRPDAADVLIVGLGGGSTLGSVLAHPNPKAVDCVEISAEVADAAREYFSKYTDHALDDQRVKLIIGDGRVHLQHTDRAYDVIISQPSNPWMAGASALFTRDFFELVKGRLRPGGLSCIWFQGFRMPVENFKSLAAAWASVWPHCSIWTSRVSGEFLFVGSPEPLSVDFARLDARFKLPKVASQMNAIMMPAPPDALSYLVAVDDGVRTVAGGATVNTDENSRIEYDTPKGMWQDHALEIAKRLHTVRVDPWRFVIAPPNDDQNANYGAARARGAEILTAQDDLFRALDLPPSRQRELITDVLRRNKHDALAQRILGTLDQNGD